MDYFSLHKDLEKLFECAGITETADIDWIMVEVLGVSRGQLPLLRDIADNNVKKIYEIAKSRAKHIPLAYILGKAWFYGRELDVNENVLIPRQDTEVLIDELVKKINEKSNKQSVLDIGTGSGAIAITTALETDSNVTVVDISEKALEVAKINAKKLGVNVNFVLSDLFDKLDGKKFDIIVSNPPYIESDVIETLDVEVKNNEPHLALDGGKSGLEFYEKIISQAPKFLNGSGSILFEIGYNQADSVSKLLEKDFKNIKVIKDYDGNDRVVIADKK